MYKISKEDIEIINLRKDIYKILNSKSLLQALNRFIKKYFINGIIIKASNKIKDFLILVKNENDFKKLLTLTNKKRLIVWYSEVGWDIPLFQRPQHLFRCFARNNNNLVFYKSAEYVDGRGFFLKKLEDNLYLVNFLNSTRNLVFKIISKYFKGNKYIYIPSTSSLTSLKELKYYESLGFKLVYDYIDDLNPALDNKEKLDKNLLDIHKYALEHENILTICTANLLLKDSIKKRKSDKNIIFSCNAVDYEHFTILDKHINLSEDFEDLLKEKKKIIGYYGAIASWFDYQMLINVAKKLPDYEFVLIGPEYDHSISETKIKNISNIHLLGPKKFDDLPYYATKFDMFILPFVINDITNATNPIKIFEYMAMEKPIITSDLPECRKYKSCLIYKNEEEFVKLIKNNINNKDENYKNILKKEALENTWKEKAHIIETALASMEKEDE